MARFRSRSSPRLRRARSPQRRWFLSWWNLWRVPTLVTIVAAIWWFGVRPITYEQGWVDVDAPFSLCGEGPRTRGCVIDGDTVILNLPGGRPRRIRFIGFDAPELEGACEAESTLARRSRQALLDWLDEGIFEWSGGEDPPFDQYGRELREVRRTAPDGSKIYLATAMMDAGLASESGWGAKETDWCR